MEQERPGVRIDRNVRIDNIPFRGELSFRFFDLKRLPALEGRLVAFCEQNRLGPVGDKDTGLLTQSFSDSS